MCASEGCAGSQVESVARRPPAYCPAASHFVSPAPVVICDSALPASPAVPAHAPSLPGIVADAYVTRITPYINWTTLDAVRVGPETRLRVSTSRARLDFGPRLAQDHGLLYR